MFRAILMFLVLSFPVAAQSDCQQYGNCVTFDNQGNSWQRQGSTVFRSDGTTYQTLGTTTFDNQGNSWQRQEDTLFSSDGDYCEGCEEPYEFDPD